MAAALIVGAAGLALGLLAAWSGKRAKEQASEALAAERVASERERTEARLAAREEFEQLRRDLENEWRERRAEVQRAESRVSQREEAASRRLDDSCRRETELVERLRAVEQREAAVERATIEQRQALERIAGLTYEAARQEVLHQAEEQARQEAAHLAHQIEDEARRVAEGRARDIIADAIERCAVEHVTEACVSVVPLASDEIKGRIIGREGRNIRSFEQLTGVDLVIDDTPEAVVISAFDPVRREVARMALEALISDGRIHPGRIEEVVESCGRKLAGEMMEAGEQAALECGVGGLSPQLTELLGRLKYRTSYGQNVLRHSLEVARMAATMAVELGADQVVARRAGLLHDIGKALNGDGEAPHAVQGMEMAKSQGESWPVVHAIGAHHRDLEPATPEAALVLVADALSAARPGARRDSLLAYVQRLERLETIAGEFAGVSKVYAIQAGREIRVVVRPEDIDDAQAAELARQLAARIEGELAYPGQIKVTVIREQRSVEYAR